MKKYKSRRIKYPISGLPFMLYALNRYDLWLEEIEKGNISVSESLPSDFSSSLDEIDKKAKLKADMEIQDFLSTVNVRKLPKKEYSKILFEEFEQLRINLNKLEHLHYFSYVDRKDVLLNMFSYNCYFGANISRQKNQLHDAIYLDEKSSFFSGELFEIYGNLTFRSKNDKKDLSYHEIFSLLNQIIFDSSLYKRFKDTMDKFMIEHQNTSKPYYFSQQEYNESLVSIFEDAVHQLKSALDQQVQTKKILFLQDRLKDLRLHESFGKLHGWKPGKYVQYFKEFLEIETEYIREIKDLYFGQASQRKLLGHGNEAVSFKYKESKIERLAYLYKELSYRWDFIKVEKTSEKDFIDVFTAKDLKSINREIHINCQTVVFAIIVNALQPYFQAKLPVIIDKSNLFSAKMVQRLPHQVCIKVRSIKA